MKEDFTSMNNPRFLYRAGMHCPFPEWIASEPIPVKGEFEKKASAAFADPERRLLPICTPAAAFHSALNIFAFPEDFDAATFERVKSAAEHYGIERDLAPYAELFLADIEKSASASDLPEGRFAIDTILGGESFKILPLNDATDVTSSAFDFAKMASDRRIPFILVVPAAREIFKAASEFGVESHLPELVARFGMPRFPDAERAAELIQGREQFCKSAAMRESLSQLYQEALAEVGTDPDSALEKIAAADFSAGIDPGYRVGAAIPNAFDVVFGGPLESEVEKVATTNVLIRSVLVPLEALKQIPPVDIDFRLSKEAADELSRLRDVDDARDVSLAVERWEEGDQRTLLRLAAACAA